MALFIAELMSAVNQLDEAFIYREREREKERVAVSQEDKLMAVIPFNEMEDTVNYEGLG